MAGRMAGGHALLTLSCRRPHYHIYPYHSQVENAGLLTALESTHVCNRPFGDYRVSLSAPDGAVLTP
jgi:hypothetical protein